MEKFRSSSFHADLTTPHDDKDKKEYAPGKYPERDPEGESVILRFKQFGVDEESLKEWGVAKPEDLTVKQYDKLVSKAVEEQNNTLFASVFGHIDELAPEEQRKLIRKTAERYQGWGLKVIKKGSDAESDEPKLLIAVEGAVDFVRSTDDADEMIDYGVRSVGLQYGRDNALATKEGLSPLGKEVSQHLLKRGVIIDLAHSNPAVRKDILDVAEDNGKGRLVSYTHGSLIEDMKKDPSFSGLAETRGLTRQELMRMSKMGSSVGVGVTRPFFKDVDATVERINETCQLDNGPEMLGLGTDFGGVFDDLKFKEIQTTSDVAVIGDKLASRFGYSDAQIKKILETNVPNWVKKSGLGSKE